MIRDAEPDFERLRDLLLGYDDDYRPTPDERVRYFATWDATAARLGLVVDLIHAKVGCRPPRHDGEWIAVRLCAAAINRAKEGSQNV